MTKQTYRVKKLSDLRTGTKFVVKKAQGILSGKKLAKPARQSLRNTLTGKTTHLKLGGGTKVFVGK